MGVGVEIRLYLERDCLLVFSVWQNISIGVDSSSGPLMKTQRSGPALFSHAGPYIIAVYHRSIMQDILQQ